MGSGASQPDDWSELEPAVKRINHKPIHTAIRWNKKSNEEMTVLLSTEEAVSCVDKSNGNRPIHIAAQNGHLNIIKLLIDKKADLNVKNLKGNTAIHMAVGYDYYEAAKMIITAGGDPNITNNKGYPAHLGLDGDKSMGIAALFSASSGDEIISAFTLCEQQLSCTNKPNFIAAGLKAKKQVGDQWTEHLQNRFKDITNRLK